MSIVLTGPCCCTPTGICGELQNFPTSFLLNDLDGTYSFERSGNNTCFGQAYCDLYTGIGGTQYYFSVTYSLVSPVTMTKSGSCYEGTGYLNLTGTVVFSEIGERDDSVTMETITCQDTQSYPFSTTVPFCLTVQCRQMTEDACGKTFGSPHFLHQLQICDFPVVNRTSFFTGDCETVDCIKGSELGFISVGAVIRWASTLKHLDQLIPTDFALTGYGASTQRCGHSIQTMPAPAEPEYPCAYWVSQNTIHGPFSLAYSYDWDWGAIDEPVPCEFLTTPANVAFEHKATGWDGPCWSVDIQPCYFDYIVNPGFLPPVYT